MITNSYSSIVITRIKQAAALFSCCLLFACSSTEVDTPVDLRPPDFTLTDLDGNPFQLSETQGDVVMLHFFAPWCEICQTEVETIKQIHSDFAGIGMVVIGIAVQASSVAQIEEFRDAYDVQYPILVDDGRVSRLGYGVSRIPTTFIIDREVNLIGPFGVQSRDDFVQILQPLF